EQEAQEGHGEDREGGGARGGGRTRRSQAAEGQGRGQAARPGRSRKEACEIPGEETGQAEIWRQRLRRRDDFATNFDYIKSRRKDLKLWPTRKQADPPATAATRTVSGSA